MTVLPTSGSGRSAEVVAVLDADTGRSVSYGRLAERVEARGAELVATADGHGPDLVFLHADHSIETVVDYLALRNQRIPVVLLPPGPTVDGDDLIDRYQPALVLNGHEPIDGYRRCAADDRSRGHVVDVRATPVEPVEPSPSASAPEPVAVLLPTSGSTGNPRLVQLTADNLDVNAADIVAALGIDGSDRGLAPLPLFYSYGLSILNSHLAAGATTVLTTASPVRPEFRTVLAETRPTSIPGVPHSFRMYRRVGLFEADIPALRSMTQAGGRLPPEEVRAAHHALAGRGRRLHVMYGQTEAGPRMSTLTPDDLPTHAGSVGVAMGSGRFEIADGDQQLDPKPGAATGCGEIIYEGPNVMLGYADRRDDLGVRTHHGRLATGDLGWLDDEGRLTVTGRIKRMAKLFGTRINLDDVEARFAADGHAVAAVDGDDTIVIFTEEPTDTEPKIEGGNDGLRATARELARSLQVPPRTIRIATVRELPRTRAGKTDYRSLRHDV